MERTKIAAPTVPMRMGERFTAALSLISGIQPAPSLHRWWRRRRRRRWRWRLGNASGVICVAKRHIRLVSPTTVNRTVRPRAATNGDLRTREYLTEAEVERLMNAATRNRWGHRDSTMVLVSYRHGLRAASWWTCAGIRSISRRRTCTCAGSNRAPQHPSHPRRRTARPAAAPARAGP